jgi:hypothetical protein
MSIALFACGGSAEPPAWVGQDRTKVDASIDDVAFTIEVPSGTTLSQALGGTGTREWISDPTDKTRALSVRVERRAERPTFDNFVEAWEPGKAYILHGKAESDDRYEVVLRDERKRHVLADVIVWRGDVTMECVAAQLWHEPIAALDKTAKALVGVCRSLSF